MYGQYGLYGNSMGEIKEIQYSEIPMGCIMRLFCTFVSTLKMQFVC